MGKSAQNINQFVGVWLKARMTKDSVAPSINQRLPIRKPLETGDDENPEAAAEYDDQENADGDAMARDGEHIVVPVLEKEGWACYYRSNIVEKHSIKRDVVRFRKMAFAHKSIKLATPRPKDPSAEQLEKEAQWRLNKRVLKRKRDDA